MANAKTNLDRRIDSGKPLLIAEMTPPTGTDPAPVREMARKCAGTVHALGISDNRDHVAMSAVAASVLVAAEGVEPILHMVTRDRNRIALVSECLGAQALGIGNLLCTSGSHQTLGRYADAKNVYDIDTVQLIEAIAILGTSGSVVGEERIAGVAPFCLGGAAAPNADPMELQVSRLAKKAAAGARFLITEPIYDLDRFSAWWNEVTRRGIHEKVAIVAGIQALGDAAKAKQLAAKRPAPRVPQAAVARIAAQNGVAAQRAEGIRIAVETVGRLAEFRGLRGFEVCGDGDFDAALEVIEKSGLKTD